MAALLFFRIAQGTKLDVCVCCRSTTQQEPRPTKFLLSSHGLVAQHFLPTFSMQHLGNLQSQLMSTEDICLIMPICYLQHQMSMVGKMALMEIINQEGNPNSWKSFMVCSVDLKHHPQPIAGKNQRWTDSKACCFSLVWKLVRSSHVTAPSLRKMQCVPMNVLNLMSRRWHTFKINCLFSRLQL